MMLNLLQEQPAGGDQLLLWGQRREPRGDEVGIDESRAWCHLRQVLQCKSRLSGAIRTGDDPADALWRNSAHTTRVLPGFGPGTITRPRMTTASRRGAQPGARSRVAHAFMVSART